jgi:hypothetical protein
MEIIAGEVPILQPFRIFAILFRPFTSICKGSPMLESPQSHDQYDSCHLHSELWFKSRSSQVENAREKQDGEIECRKVMMQEELALHDEEGEVMHCPA